MICILCSGHAGHANVKTPHRTTMRKAYPGTCLPEQPMARQKPCTAWRFLSSTTRLRYTTLTMQRRLLTRDEFRRAVFQRDGYACVFCGASAEDAHHIIERRLWSDGGYYIENGASVCEEHHRACERTDQTPEEVRRRCGITTIVLPAHLYADQAYDKWGNTVLPSGQRLKGELFFDESVQTVLKAHLGAFSDGVTYPRTYHLPWSDTLHNDDQRLESSAGFVGKRVIVTKKMDGEHTTMYQSHLQARSAESLSPRTRHGVQNFWAAISHDIPGGWRICGESLWAQQALRDEHLPSTFLGISLWNDRNVCLSWDETREWFELLGIAPVPVLYDGLYDEATIRRFDAPEQRVKNAGYVLRVAEAFQYGEFRKSVGKYVRRPPC